MEGDVKPHETNRRKWKKVEGKRYRPYLPNGVWRNARAILLQYERARNN